MSSHNVVINWTLGTKRRREAANWRWVERKGGEGDKAVFNSGAGAELGALGSLLDMR